MGIFFSKRKKTPKVSDHDLAVLQLKTQRDNIKKYQIKLEATLKNDKILAKQLLADGRRDRAKILLKKKRYQEQLLFKADQQLQNLEQITQDLEFAQVEMQVVDGLKAGNQALKKINETLNIEDIEKIMEESREGIEKQQEITDLISGALTDEDNEAVEIELAELISMNDIVPILPEVPNQELEEIKAAKVSRKAVPLEA